MILEILLWVLQVSLAVVNLGHGWLYVTWSAASDERLQRRNPGSKPLGLSAPFRIFIGVAELLAAVGLILPAATGVLPGLTPSPRRGSLS